MTVKHRFCQYCQSFKLDEGFKRVWHLKSRTQRQMCPVCQARRRTPIDQLIAQDRKAREERKKRKQP